MEWIGIFALALVACGACLLLRRMYPEYALMVSLAASVVVLAVLLAKAAPLLEMAQNLADQAGLPEGTAAILLKALGICIVCELAYDVCMDCGERALAAKVELAGKIGVLVVGLPLFQSLLSLAASLLS